MAFLLSIVALIAAPFVYAFSRRNRIARQMLDGFIFITIAGIVCIDIIPEALHAGGYPAIATLLIGLLFPFVLEKSTHLSHSNAHTFIVVLAGIGLAIHAIIDGIALLDEKLALAVIVHRLPVGMAIWWSVRPSFGTLTAAAVFIAIIMATALAYFLAAPVIAIAEAHWLAMFQAFVAGSLVHVVAFGVSHEHDENIEPAAQVRDWGYRVGILIGLFLIFAISEDGISGL